VLGVLTLQGQGGLTKNTAEAARLYRTAADLGNTSAMVDLASMLQAGEGGPANPDEAAAWMYRALTSGDSFAYQQMRKNAAAWSLPFRKAFQRVMKDNGKYSGPLDGKFGSTTFAAIDALAKPN
jgi:TPR repeat protein